jgi:hypothetical protein
MKTKSLISSLSAFTIMICFIFSLSSCKKEKNDSNIPDGAMAYYPFNSNLNDESGNANHGENYGSTFTSDRFGTSNKALDLTGSNDYVEIANSTSLNITDKLSICFWIKKGSSNMSDMCAPISKRNYSDQELHYLIILKNADGVTFQYSGAGAPSPYYEIFNSEGDVYGLLNDGNWHLVVVCHTYGSNSNDKIYIDNALYSISYTGWYTNFNYPAVPSSSTLRFGGQQVSGAEFWFDGILDDVRIYSKILSENEIQTLYQEGGWD